jgi:hypothetical protein
MALYLIFVSLLFIVLVPQRLLRLLLVGVSSHLVLYDRKVGLANLVISDL